MHWVENLFSLITMNITDPFCNGDHVVIAEGPYKIYLFKRRAFNVLCHFGLCNRSLKISIFLIERIIYTFPNVLLLGKVGQVVKAHPEGGWSVKLSENSALI